MRCRRLRSWTIACGLLPALASGASGPVLVDQSSGVGERLQAISAASELVVWASGLGGRWVRSEDGGASWTAGTVPDGSELELRDVHAVSAATAWVLAAGPGERSRIYRTDDGGRTWSEQFRNPEPEAFFDCFAFWDAQSGLAFSDSVDGRFRLLRTSDGGRSWVRSDALPAAQGSEGGFAASGTCVLTLPVATSQRYEVQRPLVPRHPLAPSDDHGPLGPPRAHSTAQAHSGPVALTEEAGRGPSSGSLAWIATAAGERPRVLVSRDRGASWSAFPVPVLGGSATSGLATVAFWDAHEGIAAGGDITLPDERADVVARTSDGGRTWTKAARPPFPGPVYGSAVVPSPTERKVVIVGPRGAALSADGARSFELLTSTEYWAVAFSSPRRGWMVGPEGRITALHFED